MIFIKVLDPLKQIIVIEITSHLVIIRDDSENTYTKEMPSIYFRTTPLDYFYFYKEIMNWDRLIQMLLRNQYLSQHFIHLKVKPDTITKINYKWSYMAQYTLMEKIETEHLFSWLSTLGGGYSALGNHFKKCAKIAAKISLQQLALCYKFGDPNMQARCKLFYSISLIQQKELKLAKKIIRQQYKFARSQNVIDTKLIKMCLGIWAKLQHSYRFPSINAS